MKTKKQIVDLILQGEDAFSPGPCVEGAERKRYSRVDVVGYLVSVMHKENNTLALSGIVDIYTNGKQTGNPKKMLKNQNYFGALSAYYDEFMFYNPNATKEEAAQALVDFVELNFPEKLPEKDFTLVDPAELMTNQKTAEIRSENPITGFDSTPGWTPHYMSYLRNGKLQWS